MKNNIAQKNIPQGWERATLITLLEEVSVRNKDRSNYPVLSVTNSRGFVLQSEHFARNLHSEDTGNYKIVSSGEFAYNPARINVGSIAKLNNFEKGLLSPMYVVFKTKENLLNNYFYHYIKTKKFNAQIKNNIAGSVRQSLNFSAFQNFDFIYPKLKIEQQKIAEILGAVDEDIAKTQEVIETTEKLKRGLMQQLFTRGIGHTKFKKTKLGEIPEKWKVVNISEVCNVFTGGTPSTSKEEYWNGNIRWMSSGEINKKRVVEVEKKITKEGLKNSNARLLPVGTVMVALAGQGKTRGMVAILDIETACNQSLAGIVPKNIEDIYSEYIFYNLDYRYKELRNINGSEGRAGLNLKIIKDIIIPLPPLKEQKKIAEILSAVDEKISVNKKLKEKLTLLKKGLMQDLLSGMVRVNIN